MVDNHKYTMVPVFLEDHKRIKDIAKSRKMSIVNLIREWIELNQIPGDAK
jgi:predicted DNA-binding ribbon-helix-helix protein